VICALIAAQENETVNTRPSGSARRRWPIMDWRISMQSHLAAVLVLGMMALVGCGSDDSAEGSSATGGTASGSGGATGATTGSSTGEGGGGAGGGGAGGGATGAGGGNTAACTSDGTACGTCSLAQCEDLYCGCREDADCNGLFECLLACNADDQDCAQACASAHEGGVSQVALAASCAASACSAECPTAQALGPCELCLFESCADDMNRCFANAECAAILDCIGECPPGNTLCAQRCAGRHPDGVDDVQRVGECTQDPCAASCQ
jgi:hypothetical protein